MLGGVGNMGDFEGIHISSLSALGYLSILLEVVFEGISMQLKMSDELQYYTQFASFEEVNLFNISNLTQYGFIIRLFENYKWSISQGRVRIPTFVLALETLVLREFLPCMTVKGKTRSSLQSMQNNKHDARKHRSRKATNSY